MKDLHDWTGGSGGLSLFIPLCQGTGPTKGGVACASPQRVWPGHSTGRKQLSKFKSNKCITSLKSLECVQDDDMRLPMYTPDVIT